MISGLSHITLVVQDLGRSAAFFSAIFSANEVYSSGAKTFSLVKRLQRYAQIAEEGE